VPKGPWKFRTKKTALSERGVWEPVIYEEDVVQRVSVLLKYSGCVTVRIRERAKCPNCKSFTTQPSDPGIPDLIGYIPPAVWARHHPEEQGQSRGVPFFIEVKRPKTGRKRYAQVAFIDSVKADGVLAFFADGWDVVKAEFKRIGVTLAGEG
jgi:hypothetical protein